MNLQEQKELELKITEEEKDIELFQVTSTCVSGVVVGFTPPSPPPPLTASTAAAVGSTTMTKKLLICYFFVMWLFSFNLFIFVIVLKLDYFQTLFGDWSSPSSLLTENTMNRLIKKSKHFHSHQQYKLTTDLSGRNFRTNNISHWDLFSVNLTNNNDQLMKAVDDFDVHTMDKQCTPIQNVAFVKTHKTGSSTITNILNRFADFRELNVALPAMGDVRFAWPRKFHWSNVDLLRLDGQPANILANHARYNRKQMDLIMNDRAKYITILRSPVTQFESSFYYFEFDRVLRLKGFSDPVKEFLRFPDEYLYNMTLILNDLPETMNLIQSGMFYDLGYDFVDTENDSVIAKMIDELEMEFQTVLIMEYFDESLVLLKLEMCWQVDDILYIKQNQRLKRFSLRDEVSRRILEWSRADDMLYQHFNRTLWKKINKYGSLFWSELQEFKTLNSRFQDICSPEKITMKGFKINVDVSSYVMNPKVERYHRYLCEKVLMTEVEYLSYFRKKLGMSSGYQRILTVEGLRPLHRKNILQRRINAKLRPLVMPPRDLSESSIL